MNIKDALNEVQIKYLSAKLCCCILVLQLGYHHQKWNFEMVFVHFGVKYFLKKHFLFLCYCVSISHSSIFISILTAKCVITKGQLISKCPFGVHVRLETIISFGWVLGPFEEAKRKFQN